MDYSRCWTRCGDSRLGGILSVAEANPHQYVNQKQILK